MEQNKDHYSNLEFALEGKNKGPPQKIHKTFAISKTINKNVFGSRVLRGILTYLPNGATTKTQIANTVRCWNQAITGGGESILCRSKLPDLVVLKFTHKIDLLAT